MGKIILFLVVFLSSLSLVYAESCDFKLEAKTTKDLLNSIDSINQGIENCSVELPFPISFLFRNDNTEIVISRTDRSQEIITLEFSKGLFKGFEKGSVEPDFSVSISECYLDSVLSDGDNIGVLASLYLEKTLEIKGTGFGSKMKLGASRPFLKFGFNKIKKEIEFVC